MAQATDEVLDKWGKDMEAWQKENKHLPNMQPAANMVKQMKTRRDQMANQGGPGGPGGPGAPAGPVDGRLSSLEAKVDRLMAHLGVK